MTLLRHFWHLVTRFFGVVTGRPLSPIAQDEVNRRLSPAEAALFWQQQPIDQRHAYEVAERVGLSIGDHEEAIAAALLHDVGKRHSKLGPISRSVATVAGGLRLPMPDSWTTYRNHGRLGARDLEQAEASPLAIQFAAGTAEPGTGSDVWAALMEADNASVRPRKRRNVPGDGVSGNSMPPEVST